MEKKRNKNLLILVSILIIGITSSFAYFAIKSIIKGNGTKVQGTTVNIGDTTITMSGDLEIHDTDIYPGHENISSLHVRAVGNRKVSFNLIFKGNNTIQTPLKYQIYKTSEKQEVSITCEKKETTRREDKDILIDLEETCTRNNIESLGNVIKEGTLPIDSEEFTTFLLMKEEIQASSEGTDVYYYIVVEYPSSVESQNKDSGLSYNGIISIELSNDNMPSYILADKKIKTRSDFKVLSKDTTGTIYQAEDNDGISYYYAGKNENNFIKFGQYQKDTYYGFQNETSTSYKEYNSLEECQAAESYNVNCTALKGKDIYWRIIRVNGDGSLRLIYNGLTAEQKSNTTQIGTSRFNEDFKDNAYVGYMYGKATPYIDQGKSEMTASRSMSSTSEYYYGTEYEFNEQTGTYKLSGTITSGTWNSSFINQYTCFSLNETGTCATLYKIDSYIDESNATVYSYTRTIDDKVTYVETHANTNSSTVKAIVDTWYENNILNSKYEQYIDTNAGFCGDRTVDKNANVNYQGEGYGKEKTGYAAYGRIYNKGWKADPTPSYKCSNNDLYTVSSANKGNKALTYPIGLITSDEAVYAGAKGGTNNVIYWLFTSKNYWTMSPAFFQGSSAAILLVSATINNGLANNNSVGVRPVINIKSDVEIAGSGTTTDPYRIVE